MGIQGLLPNLKDIQVHRHISHYKGMTLGVDAYVWLHKGAYACAQDLVQGVETNKYIQFAIGKIRLLQHHGIKPYIVFDGDRLPSKAGTEQGRESRRTENRMKAQAALQAGQANAHELFAKCVDITPEMAFQLIKYLRKEGIPYLVAPYEADAQLAFLEKEGHIDGIITEDSDLLVFGCKRVLFKLDSDGHCSEITQDRFSQCTTLKLSGWTIREFRQMAILSGCDYLPSIAGLGLKNAHKLLRQYKTPDRVVRHIMFEGKLGKVPENYLQDFRRAELTFVHQRVFDPLRGKMTMLHPVPPGVPEEEALQVDFCGAVMQDEIAAAIARGDVDPISRLPMVDICPNLSIATTTNAAASAGNQQAERNAAASTSSTNDGFYKLEKKDKTVPQIKGQQSLASFFTPKTGASASSSFAAKGKKTVSSASTTTTRTPIASVQVQATRKVELQASRFFGSASVVEQETEVVEEQEEMQTVVKVQEMSVEVQKAPAADAGPTDIAGDDSGYWDHVGAWKVEREQERRRKRGEDGEEENTSPAGKTQALSSSPDVTPCKRGCGRGQARAVDDARIGREDRDADRSSVVATSTSPASAGDAEFLEESPPALPPVRMHIQQHGIDGKDADEEEQICDDSPSKKFGKGGAHPMSDLEGLISSPVPATTPSRLKRKRQHTQDDDDLVSTLGEQQLDDPSSGAHEGVSSFTDGAAQCLKDGKGQVEEEEHGDANLQEEANMAAEHQEQNQGAPEREEAAGKTVVKNMFAKFAYKPGSPARVRRSVSARKVGETALNANSNANASAKRNHSAPSFGQQDANMRGSSDAVVISSTMDVDESEFASSPADKEADGEEVEAANKQDRPKRKRKTKDGATFTLASKFALHGHAAAQNGSAGAEGSSTTSTSAILAKFRFMR